MWLSWNVRWCLHFQLENTDNEAGPIVKLRWVILAKAEMLMLQRLKCCLHSLSPSTSWALLRGKMVLLRQALGLQPMAWAALALRA